jgi:transposase InsO family protein
MRKHGIRTKQPKRYRITTNSNHDYPIAPNLLHRDFSADAPNRKWLADITYIDTEEDWLYLAVILDVYSRQMVGWAMDSHMETALVERALKMALLLRRPPPGLIHHSDRGSQYASIRYQALLTAHHIQASMSRIGDCYDNAMMESFFGTLKTECVLERYPTHAAARVTIFEYIEGWYNRQRRHSALGYLSPLHFEQQHYDSVNCVSTKVG